MDHWIEIVLSSEHAEGNLHQLARWLKAEGDFVEAHEPLLEIDTDKATIEIASPASGTLVKISKIASDSLAVGEVLGFIDPSGSSSCIAGGDGAERHEALRARGKEDAKLSPAVRALLASHGVSSQSITGSGEQGRITVDDVMAYVRTHTQGIQSKKIPHSAMRRSIASHMTESLRNAPHVTAFVEVDMSAVHQHRKKLLDKAGQPGSKVTPLAYIIKACVAGLKEVPQLNSQWHHDVLEIFESYHIGIAVALGDKGLVAPVLFNADQLDLLQVAAALQALAERARNKEFSRSELEGSTFTISNHGIGGSLFAAPIIINQPQAAILGVGKIEDRAVVVNHHGTKTIEIRPCAYISVTIDHRAIDGSQADYFLATVKSALETWKD